MIVFVTSLTLTFVSWFNYFLLFYPKKKGLNWGCCIRNIRRENCIIGLTRNLCGRARTTLAGPIGIGRRRRNTGRIRMTGLPPDGVIGNVGCPNCPFVEGAISTMIEMRIKIAMIENLFIFENFSKFLKLFVVMLSVWYFDQEWNCISEKKAKDERKVLRN